MIRTYCDHLKTERLEIMLALQKDSSEAVKRAIAAEILRITEEEFAVLTGKDFHDAPNTRDIQEYFGYPGAADAAELEKMAGTGMADGIHEFLRRSGITYVDLVELTKTTFINPHQHLFNFLEDIFKSSGLPAITIYQKLQQIHSGTLVPSADAEIMVVLEQAEISSDEFISWVESNFEDFNKIITLYQARSACNLDTTYLRIIANVYADVQHSGIKDEWSRIHRFIGLWRILGWEIHEVDLMLTALGESDITEDTINKLSSLVLLNKELKRPVNELAVLWGSIDTYGDQSLYKKLFLNKSVQGIDPVFAADIHGNYLQDNTVLLGTHVPALLAAFRISDEEFQAIINTAVVIDDSNTRRLNLVTDKLNIANLSTLYRYVVLSKALKLKIADLCSIIRSFKGSVFSTWNVQEERYISISPATTYDFYKLTATIKQSGFKSAMLEYIFTGLSTAQPLYGLDIKKVNQAALAISDNLTAIEQAHPATPASPLSIEMISSKLSFTFNNITISRLATILNATFSAEVVIDKDLDITIPEELTLKYSYHKATGRLKGTGIMTGTEKVKLKALIELNESFTTAIDAMYEKSELYNNLSEKFIKDNFRGVFTDMDTAVKILLNRPEQAVEPALEQKLELIYSSYVPLLKQSLRQNLLTQQIAGLVGLSEAFTEILLTKEYESLMDLFDLKGFSGEYFSASGWGTSVFQRIDKQINFDWAAEVPAPTVPADNFSVRWQAYVSPPSGGTYTMVVTVKENNETFTLYLDDAVILKSTSDEQTTWKVDVELNASQLHRLVLEYAETTLNAGITLSWKAATSELQTIPFSAAFPIKVIDDFTATVSVLDRAAKFITGFKLNEKEIAHFIKFSGDFDRIDLKLLTGVHWKRINDYVQLRNSIPQIQTSIIDVFALANNSSAIPNISALTQLLCLATGWITTR